MGAQLHLLCPTAPPGWRQGHLLPGAGGPLSRAPPLPSHLVLGLETLPSVSACLGTPVQDPQPPRQE